MREADGGLERLSHVSDWKASDVFTPDQRLALELADRMTITGQVVDDDLFAQLKEHFDEKQIVELAAAIAFENFRSKFNPTFAIEPQGLCLKRSG
ncbi:MAG: carboxymuconolactone decarboxylase family protein [Hyphomicrobiaceae bacterium]